MCLTCKRFYYVVQAGLITWREFCEEIEDAAEFVQSRDFRLQILDGLVSRDFFADTINGNSVSGFRWEMRCHFLSKADFKKQFNGHTPESLGRAEMTLAAGNRKITGFPMRIEGRSQYACGSKAKAALRHARGVLV